MRKLGQLMAVLLVLLSHSTALAQSSSVTGRVVDPQGASVANAEISLVPGAAQRTRSARSNADGAFTIDGVASGQYSLLVRAPGFTESSQSITVGSSAST